MIKKTGLLLVLLMIPFISQGQATDHKTLGSVGKNPANIRLLQEMGADILMEVQNRVYFLAIPEKFDFLAERNILFRLEDDPFQAGPQFKSESQGGINGAYHTYAELEQELMDLCAAYPHIARIVDIGDSHEGRNIYALKITDNPDDEENEPAVLFLGCHHAREWISVEIPFHFGAHLLKNYAAYQGIRDMVNNCVIWIIPLVNPDGLEYSIHYYRYWRKNMKANADGSFGVDLNRNYSYKWGYDNIGSSPNPREDVYRGNFPFSEPETAAVRVFFEGKNIKVLASYHSYGQLIIYPWGYTDAPAEDRDKMHMMAGDMSRLIESVHGTDYNYGQAGAGALYTTNGDTTDWAYGTYGIPSFTVELPPADFLNGGFINAEDDIRVIFEENLPAMRYLIQWAIEQEKKPAD